jgi:hypothetical protein
VPRRGVAPRGELANDRAWIASRCHREISTKPVRIRYVSATVQNHDAGNRCLPQDEPDATCNVTRPPRGGALSNLAARAGGMRYRASAASRSGEPCSTTWQSSKYARLADFAPGNQTAARRPQLAGRDKPTNSPQPDWRKQKPRPAISCNGRAAAAAAGRSQQCCHSSPPQASSGSGRTSHGSSWSLPRRPPRRASFLPAARP